MRLLHKNNDEESFFIKLNVKKKIEYYLFKCQNNIKISCVDIFSHIRIA